MARRLNYTGRRKIRSEDVRVFLAEGAEGESTFSVQFSLDRYRFPDEAQLFIEAYRQASWMRFPAGTIGRPSAPSNCALSFFDDPASVRFRLKVVQPGEPHSQLLGVRDRISPGEAGDETDHREPLLPVKPQDLGQQIWRVEIEDRPRLLVNSRIGDVVVLARDPAFTALVYPNALREILKQILVDEDHRSTDDMDDWRCQWIRFATLLPGMTDRIPGEAEEVVEWIDEAVQAFCRRHNLLQQFVLKWNFED